VKNILSKEDRISKKKKEKGPPPLIFTWSEGGGKPQLS
jgi:hypothetical protein